MPKSVEISPDIARQAAAEGAKVVSMFQMEGPVTVDLRPTLSLKPAEMTRLWELGILSTTAYLFLVIKYEVESGRWRDRCVRPEGQADYQMEVNARDYEHLSRTWRGITAKNERGDVKELDFEAIDAALAALGKKEVMFARTRQMTLFFGSDADIYPGAVDA